VNRSDFTQFISLPVQWGDMDAVGHVNNAIYFRYVESGRIAYFSALDDGIDVQSGMSEGPILADIQCSYLGQLHYPAQIDVGTRTSKLGGKSFTVEAGIFVAGEDEPVATSRAVVVWFDYANQQTTAVPDRIRQRILEIEAVAPDA
jgi:acyl-CoA thioester hydrolase